MMSNSMKDFFVVLAYATAAVWIWAYCWAASYDGMKRNIRDNNMVSIRAKLERLEKQNGTGKD